MRIPVIPQRKSELRDHLGYMVLCCPNDFPDDYGPEYTHDVDSSFSDLDEGIKLLTGKLGAQKAERMLEMSKEAKQLYVDGFEKEGAWRLQDIMKEIGKRELR